ncbi:MAG TPA: hypothetical protein VFN35_37130, partial [Ktedonobacteraceae bacterium]|nr:hypothetical protein [Ktedonobacteraceae bacterium]
MLVVESSSWELHMPVILVALFAIALLVTCIGLFLSPKSSTPRFRNNSPASPRVRRLVETAVVVPMRESGSPVRAPSRARRRIVTSTSALVSMEEGRSMAAAASIPARASRSMRVVNVDMDVVMVSRPRPRARVNQTRASISVPAFRKG